MPKAPHDHERPATLAKPPGRRTLLSITAMPTGSIRLSPAFVQAIRDVAPKPRARALPYALGVAVVVTLAGAWVRWRGLPAPPVVASVEASAPAIAPASTAPSPAAPALDPPAIAPAAPPAPSAVATTASTRGAKPAKTPRKQHRHSPR